MRRISSSMAVCVMVGVAGLGFSARAHETDQYTLPLDKPFADVGDLLDASHYRIVARAVERANREIERALREPESASMRKRLATLRSQEYLVEAVYSQMNDAMSDISGVESALRGKWAKEAYPGQYTEYSTLDWIYTYSHAWLDPRRLITVWRSSTIKAYGVYFGSDKMSHFHHMGHFYYTAWRENLGKGMSESDAVANVIVRYSGGGPLGETGLLGFAATGVYSNADLCSNYMGFKFFRNITEPMVLKGEERPPMVVRTGPFWRLNVHVRPESGWFGAFVSDHWNEAMNPNLYDVTIRADVKSLIERRSESIMKFWTQRDGRPADAAYYEKLAGELSTYFGENYGHSSPDTPLMTLGNTVIPAMLARRSSGAKP
ncbi:hypothetical protein PHYC_02071 [Phycisphaerales bacterium]|nr:hypothetical protein PHYC_02071 [Phycisphaerales bacterium]